MPNKPDNWHKYNKIKITPSTNKDSYKIHIPTTYIQDKKETITYIFHTGLTDHNSNIDGILEIKLT